MKVILQQAQILHTYGILWGRQINLNPDLSLKVHDILIERLYITKKKISWVATKPSKAL